MPRLPSPPATRVSQCCHMTGAVYGSTADALRPLKVLLASISAVVASVCVHIYSEPRIRGKEGSRAAGVVICFTFNKMGWVFK